MSTRRMAPLFAGAGVLCVVCGCEEDLTQLMLVLDTELAVPSEVSSLHVQVTGPSGRSYEATAELGLDRPATLALVSPDGRAVSGDVTVVATMRLDGARVASRSVTTSFIEGRVKAVPICVARACTTSCPELNAPGASLRDWSGSASSPCAPDGPDGGVPDGAVDPTIPLGQAMVVRQIDGQGIFMHRVELRAGAQLENLSDVFERAFGPTEYPDDRGAAFSPNGEWMIVNLDRGSCVGWGCLYLGRSDDPASIRPMQVRFTSDSLLHVDGAAIGDGGDLVVYPGEPGVDGHQYDLWATRLVDGEWTMPVLLTTDSIYPYNKLPRLSPDGTRVLFGCSYEIYGYDNICEVGIDGTGHRVVLHPDQAPPGIVAERGASLDSPRYEPDGSILFSTTWTGEQLWRLRPGADDPVRVLGPFDVGVIQPCVLSSGHIVAIRGTFAADPGPTLAVFEDDGDLLFELGTDYVPGQLTWLNDCAP